jgi:hypothetical protein
MVKSQMKQRRQRQDVRGLWTEMLFEFFVGIYLLTVVVICWQQPIWISLLLGGAIAMELWFWRDRADAVMMMGAALLGTPSEMLCVKLGVWTYRAPGVVLGIPVWIPLVWASLFCLFRRLALTMRSFTRRVWSDEKGLATKIFYWGLGGLILVYYFITVSVIRRPIAAVYTVFMIPAVVFWHGRRDMLIFVIGGALGTLGEVICMKLGFWQYHYPLFRSIGLPLSLPLAWGLSAVIVGRIARIWETPATSTFSTLGFIAFFAFFGQHTLGPQFSSLLPAPPPAVDLFSPFYLLVT